MVLPHGLLAFYYAPRGKPEILYRLHVGHGHIRIPLCIGIYALFRPIQVPELFRTGVIILIAASIVHFLFIAVLGRLPRFMGWILTALYGVFLYKGLG